MKKGFGRRVRLACVGGILAGLAACAMDSDESPPAAEADSPPDDCPACRQFFSAKNLSLKRVEGADLVLRISANSVAGRPRVGRLVTFDNYDEIYLTHALIEQPLKGGAVRLDLQGIVQVVSQFDEGSLGGARESAEETTDAQPQESLRESAEEAVIEVEPKPESHRMSRMLVDDIRISIKPGRGLPVVLAAGRAALAADAAFMRFERNLKLQAAHCRISAPLAVWSGEYQGLFLPTAYWLNGRRQVPGGFYRISSKGHCAKITPAPTVQYADMLDKVEDKVAESLPMSLRLFLGFIGQPAGIPH